MFYRCFPNNNRIFYLAVNQGVIYHAKGFKSNITAQSIKAAYEISKTEEFTMA